MSNRKKKRKQGFTLIETLVGTGVFAIGIVGAVGLQQWAMQATSTSGRMVSAGAVGQAQLEKMLDDGFGNASTGSKTDGQYTMRWTVTPSNGFKKVALDVEWDTPGGHRKKVSTSSMIAEELKVVALPGFAMPGNGGHGGIPAGAAGN